jgi:hypothetical protein
MYRERAADWVLPWILNIPTGVAIGLIVNEIQRVIDGARAAKQALPTIRFRGVVIEDGRTTARELTGPADEMQEMLSRRLEGRLLDAEMSEPIGADEGVVISGYVAHYEPLRPAADMRGAATHEASAAIAERAGRPSLPIRAPAWS